MCIWQPLRCRTPLNWSMTRCISWQYFCYERTPRLGTRPSDTSILTLTSSLICPLACRPGWLCLLPLKGKHNDCEWGNLMEIWRANRQYLHFNSIHITHNNLWDNITSNYRKTNVNGVWMWIFEWVITDRKGRYCFHRRLSFCPQSASWLLDHCWSLLQHGRYASCWNAFLYCN